MWVLIIVVSLFVLLLIGLLVMPFELEINTYKNIYEIRIGKISRTNLVITDEGEIGIKVRIAWYKKYFRVLPLPEKKEEKEKRTEKNKRTKRKKPGIKNVFKRILSVIKSFKVIRLTADIDTDDYILNAYLYPVVFMLKHKTGRNVNINFSGRTDADILIRNNLWRVCFSFINYK